MHSVTEFLSQLLSGGTGSSLTFGQTLLAVLISYLGGILASLTPCVYPMIPITIGVVGGVGSAKKSWKEVFIRSLSYVGGMTVIYSLLGVLAGVSGRVFGSFTNTSNWYLGLGILLSFTALMMLDVISFSPLVVWELIKRKLFQQFSTPHKYSAQIQKEMTWIAAFALGASSGLIAAPCTTPVLTAILAYIAQSHSIFIGFALMLAFSLGLGTLLLTLAIFAGLIQILPRSGQWMKTVKIACGLILLAFADYLIYRAGNWGGP